jgi:PAS domain S-box-containing protein
VLQEQINFEQHEQTNIINSFHYGNIFISFKTTIIFLIICIGIILSCLAFIAYESHSNDKFIYDFKRTSRDISHSYEKIFERYASRIHQITDLYNQSINITNVDLLNIVNIISDDVFFSRLFWTNKGFSKKNVMAGLSNNEDFKILKKYLASSVKHSIDHNLNVMTEIFPFHKDHKNTIAMIRPANYQNHLGALVGIIDLTELFATFKDSNKNPYQADVYFFDISDANDEKFLYSTTEITNKMYYKGYLKSLTSTKNTYFTKEFKIFDYKLLVIVAADFKKLYLGEKIYFHLTNVVDHRNAFIILLFGIITTVIIALLFNHLININENVSKMVIDRTERVISVSANLTKNQNEILLILDNIVDGVITFNSNGIIETINPAIVNIFNYTAKDIMGEPMTKILIENEKFHFQSILQEVLNGKSIYVKDNAIKLDGHKKDGKIISIKLGLSLVPKSSIIVGIISDISYDVHMSNQMSKYAHELSLERNKAQAASDAKGEFLANMSHEIRTPMNVIVGTTELLQGTRINIEQQDYVDTISISCDILLDIINNILDLSKIEYGEQQLNTSDVFLGDLLKNIVKFLSQSAHKNCNVLIARCDPKLNVAFILDSTKLKRVLINLISNAIKFSKNSNIYINIIADGSDYILFEVTDNGIGIDPSQLSMVFESFTQADQSTTKIYGGTGLGLSICKKLVDIMEGEIGANSVLNKGSTFWFKIPAQKSIIHDSNPWYHNPLQKKLKVLVVGEDKMKNSLVIEYLDYYKINYDIAYCGKSALQSVFTQNHKDKYYDFIFLDQDLSDIYWKKMLDMLCGIGKLKHYTKIVLITNSDCRDEEVLNKHNMYFRYLVRPILAENLLALFNNVSLLQQEKVQAVETEEVQKKFDLDVLVVEDYAPNLRLISKMLQRYGFRVHAANGGEEALALMTKSNFDVIFMDCQMPNMDGYETTEIIRKNEIKHNIIIAMTANALIGDKEKCIAAGMDDYIAKPMKQIELEQMLEKWVPRHTMVEA